MKISSALLLGLLFRSIALSDTAKPVINQLFTFQLAPDNTFPDGALPGPIIQASDGNFYGTTTLGGDDGNHCQQPQACGGTIFKLTPAGQITILYTFAYGSATAPYANGVNILPRRLVEGPDGYLYGTTYQGGNGGGSAIKVSSGGGGTVFKISKTGDFHTLHQFCAGAGCDEGSGPSALVLGPDGKFYGTTVTSGSNHSASKGTIFRISAPGVVETLHNFDGFADGGAPVAGLVQASDGNLYGTTSGGGSSQYAVGTVFRITPAGVFSVLYTFQLEKPNPIKDGQDAEQPLIQACHGKLYGVTKRGGVNQLGTVFQIGLDGQNYKTLFDLTKSQFGDPDGLLLATDGNLWGGASLVVYTVSTAGVLLQTSAPICAGVGINGPLIQGTDGKLYGSAQQCAFPSGGGGGQGTIFSVDAGLPKPPVPIAAAATNGASFVAGSIVPGEIATVFGTEITSSTGINLASTLPLPTDFQNVSVLVNGIAAPIFAVDNLNGQEQINFQVPWEVAGQSTATIQVENNCHTSAPLTVAVLPAQPGIINYSAGGASYGVILHADYQLADAGHPVKTGETVLIYGTGSGTVISPPADGAAASGQITTAPAVVTIGGVTASVPFSGLAPEFVGLNQINVVVPAGLTPGNQPVVVTIDGVASNAVQLPVH